MIATGAAAARRLWAVGRTSPLIWRCPAPCRSVALSTHALSAPEQQPHDSAPGLVVPSATSLQDELVDRALRGRLLQSRVLRCKLPQPLRLIDPQAAVALAPAEVRLLRHPDRFVACATGWPWPISTSASRSLWMISSVVYLCLPIFQVSSVPLYGTSTWAKNRRSRQVWLLENSKLSSASQK